MDFHEFAEAVDSYEIFRSSFEDNELAEISGHPG